MKGTRYLVAVVLIVLLGGVGSAVAKSIPDINVPEEVAVEHVIKIDRASLEALKQLKLVPGKISITINVKLPENIKLDVHQDK